MNQRALEINANVRRQEATTVRMGLGRLPLAQDYFLPAFFAAQYAFNLADNFALVAGLNVFFPALAVRLAERVAGLAWRIFAHRAF
jgi:hypothetical protein